MNKNDEVRRVRILEQAEMIVNTKSNSSFQIESKLDIFQNFSEILKGYGFSFAFQKSLENSKNCCEFEGAVEREIHRLQNQDDSFLILVNDTYGHVFSTVIKKYKEQEQDKYSAMLVNVGYRKTETGKHHKYEEYVFTNKNKLIEVLSFVKDSASVSDIYRLFKESSDEDYINIIHGEEQNIRNCYLKEIEKGIKASMIPILTIIDTRIDSDFKGEIFKNIAYRAKFNINNNVIETEKIHSDYFDLLADENPDIAQELIELKKSYLVNKNIRDSMGNETNIQYSQDEMNKNIDIKTMKKIIVCYYKGFDVSKFIDSSDMKKIGNLVVKIADNEVSAFDEFNKISGYLKEKYPRFYENASNEVSVILSTLANKKYNKSIDEKNSNELEKAVSLAVNAYTLYQNNSVAIDIIARGYEHLKDKKSAVEYHEKNLGLRTEPNIRKKLRSKINQLCSEISNTELINNRFESALEYLNKMDNEAVNKNELLKEFKKSLTEYNKAKYSGNKMISQRRQIKKRLIDLTSSGKVKKETKEIGT